MYASRWLKVKKESEQRIKRSDELSNQRSGETGSRERNNRGNIDESGWPSFVLARDNATFLFTGLVSLVISVLVQCPMRATPFRPEIPGFSAWSVCETKFSSLPACLFSLRLLFLLFSFFTLSFRFSRFGSANQVPRVFSSFRDAADCSEATTAEQSDRV